MLTMNDLKELQQRTNVEKQGLIDITDVQMNSALPFSENTEHFFASIGNPYHFLCGEMPVLIRFSNHDKSLSQKLERHFIRQKA